MFIRFSRENTNSASPMSDMPIERINIVLCSNWWDKYRFTRISTIGGWFTQVFVQQNEPGINEWKDSRGTA